MNLLRGSTITVRFKSRQTKKEQPMTERMSDERLAEVRALAFVARNCSGFWEQMAGRAIDDLLREIERARADCSIAENNAVVMERTAANQGDQNIALQARVAALEAVVERLQPIVDAAVGVRIHGGDYLHGTHGVILWRLVDERMKCRLGMVRQPERRGGEGG